MHFRERLFQKAAFDYLYCQDDDCLAPIPELLAQCVPDRITCAMKPEHLKGYADKRMALLGWGSIIPKRALRALEPYRQRWGEDALFCREWDRILTSLNFPQQRLALPIQDLPSATAPDRLWRQPGHYDQLPLVEARCADLLAAVPC